VSRAAGMIRALLWALLASRPVQAQPESSPFQTVIRAPRSDARPGEWTLRSEDGKSVAGGLGDPLRALDTSAAVARSALGSGAVVVWGSAPSDTRVVYMGMELPMLYHLGGLRGVLPASMLRDVTLSPAAFASEYGRAQGGLIVISPRPIEDGLHGELAADLLDVSASLSAQLGSRLRAAFAFRYSYLDRLLAALSRPDLGDFFPLPQYLDAQLRLSVRVSDQSSLDVVALASSDALRRARASGDASRAQSELWQQSFYRLGLAYERRGADGSRLQLVPWLGLDRTRYEASFGGTPAARDEDALLYGLRTSYGAPLVLGALAASLRVGLDLLGQRSELSRSGSLSRPPREGDIAVFGQRPGFEQSADAWSVHSLDLALHTSLPLRVRWLFVEPGLRLSGTLIDASRLLPHVGAAPPIGSRDLSFALEPRVLARLSLRPQLALILAAGLHHQPPAASDLSAVFGNPTLRLQRAVHGSFSFEWMLRERLQIHATAYLRVLDQQVARSPLATPALGRALTQDGSGLSYGGQLVLRLPELHISRFALAGWASYTLSRSERRDTPQAAVRPFAWDQTHGLQAALQARVLGLMGSLRLRYATGLVRTPVIGSYYNAWADQYEPLLGPLYSARLPDFVQLDLRLEYTLRLGSRLGLSVQLEVQNITNQANVEEQAYSHDFTAVEPIVGLPTVAVLGLRIAR